MKVFLSYRRDDSGGYAGRLADDLIGHFGKSRIFRDVDSIRPGADFVQAIEAAVGSCEVLVAVIGRDWLDARSASGDRRLDNPDDFVRLEIAAALKRSIPVVPVLVEGATMPSAADLPPDLSRLPRYNAIELQDPGWAYGVSRLIEVLGGGNDRQRGIPQWVKFAAPAVAILALVVAAVTLLRPDDPAAPVDRYAVTSYDQTADSYFGTFRTVTQKFTAQSNRITYVAVRVGVGGFLNIELKNTMRIDLCGDKDCASVLAVRTPIVQNYRDTVAEFDAAVTPGREYAVRWHEPDTTLTERREGTRLLWDTFWAAGSTGPRDRKDVREADKFLMVVRGYNA